MEEKITAKNKNVSQIGLSTHNQDHEINPVAFSTTKISVKTTRGSTPDRLTFCSIPISTSKNEIYRFNYITVSPKRQRAGKSPS